MAIILHYSMGFTGYTRTVDEPPGSVHSEIADSTYNLSPISLMRPFTKTNVASPAQVELY